jgi:hypothetical protein
VSAPRSLAALALAALAGCQATSSQAEPLATPRMASDFESYEFRRVGLVPFAGRVTGQQQTILQDAFLLELSRAGDHEIVRLRAEDLAEVQESEPYRRGRYEPKTVLELCRRFSLDGVLVGTVTQLEPYPPQRLSLQLDLIATETGMVVWSSSVQLDASEPRVRKRLEGNANGEPQLALISPERFARFAAREIALGLPGAR